MRKYKPRLIRHNLFLPLPQVSHPFKSICLNYVLHCLPGDFTEKEKVVFNLKKAMAPEGVLFGSTILSASVTESYLARSILTLYNYIGSFHNTHDNAGGLKMMLSKHFQYVNCRLIGSVCLFAASDRNLQHS